jgi:hypothetical protein
VCHIIWCARQKLGALIYHDVIQVTLVRIQKVVLLQFFEVECLVNVYKIGLQQSETRAVIHYVCRYDGSFLCCSEGVEKRLYFNNLRRRSISVSEQSKYGRTFAKYARIFGFDAYLPKVLSRSTSHIWKSTCRHRQVPVLVHMTILLREAGRLILSQD